LSKNEIRIIQEIQSDPNVEEENEKPDILEQELPGLHKGQSQGVD